ncbi:MAG TPA: ZIP family zinc transporter [Polyangia bacterium]|jgi:ZIP family zinc transporter|nr:ZIP family zinc transporter [Polyangia bacterium]
MIPLWLQAGLWGLLAGSALLIGAATGYLAPVPQRVTAAVMAFGGGVLISALSFDLIDEAYRRGGFTACAVGFLLGALVYTLANWQLGKRGAKHRKRSGDQQPSEADIAGSGLAIAIGALLDGVPESIVIGVSMLAGGTVSLVAVAAIFLSNVPEGLSSSAGMKKAHRSPFYIFGVWGGIALISGLSSLAGYSIFRYFSPAIIAATTAVAAGAILAMLADTMIPEAFAEAHNLAGFLAVVGFLAAFTLSKVLSPAGDTSQLPGSAPSPQEPAQAHRHADAGQRHHRQLPR